MSRTGARGRQQPARHRARTLRLWQRQWRDDWQAIRPILRGAPTLTWPRLVGRIIDHPAPGYPGFVRTRVLIEELYGKRAASTVADGWLDSHTHSLLTAAIGRLLAYERALAEGELAVLLLQDRWMRHRRRLHRVTLLLPVVGVVLGVALTAVGFGWSAIVVIGITGGVSYGVAAAGWLSTYRAARRIWRAYAAQGGPPF